LLKIKELNIFKYFNYFIANIFVKLSLTFQLVFAILNNFLNVNKISK